MLAEEEREPFLLFLSLLVVALGLLRAGMLAKIMMKIRRRMVAMMEAAMMPAWTIFLWGGGEGRGWRGLSWGVLGVGFGWVRMGGM